MANTTRNRAILAISTIGLSVVVLLEVWFIEQTSVQKATSVLTVEQLEQLPKAYIYLKDEATQAEVVNLMKQLKTLPGVMYVGYTSKEEALEVYKAINSHNPILLELVTPGMLPASIDVYYNDPSVLLVANRLAKDKRFVEEFVGPPGKPH